MKLIVQDDSGNEVFHLFFYGETAAIPDAVLPMKKIRYVDSIPDKLMPAFLKYREWKAMVRELRRVLESAELWPLT